MANHVSNLRNKSSTSYSTAHTSRYPLISFKVGSECEKIVSINDIILIEKVTKTNSLIVTIRGEFKVRSSLNNLQDYLDPLIFFRSHRSFIVNLKYLDKIEKKDNYHELSFYKCNYKALISSRKKDDLKKHLKTVI